MCNNVCATMFVIKCSWPAEVMSVIFRCNGYQFAGPTQMLPPPTSVSDEQASEAMKTFSATLKKEGQIPCQKISLSSKAFEWKEFRVATKNVLSALANALIHSLGPGFSMKEFQPPNILCAAGIYGDRLELTEMEKATLGMSGLKGPRKFIYDFKTHECALDCYLHEKFHRLIFSADEGTEA